MKRNALVTVGTTPFPSLVSFFDKPVADFEVVIQCGDPTYRARHARCFAFARQIQEHYDRADVIVTHAGAGSVYSLLEMGKRLVVVPNLDRADKHQLDLAGYVRSQRYAVVVERLQDSTPDDILRRGLEFEPAPYVKRPFFMANFIEGLLPPE
jgi:beta-1,4-N-acetylglucosaminyltransferase